MNTKKTNRAITVLDGVISFLCVCLTGIQLANYIFGIFPAMQQRSLFLGFILSIILLIHIRNKIAKGILDLWSIFILLGIFFASVYIFVNWYEMSFRVIRPEKMDLLAGILIIAAVIDCANIRLGRTLPFIALLFIIYALFGQYIKGSMGTVSFTVQRIISILTMETSGIYGTILGTAAKQIFVFIILGSSLELSGASEFFLKMASILLGSRKGSGAKVNTMAGGLLGMVSGSAVANVMAVGPMTFPMMKKDGFSNYFCGAIAAISGTGGQLMPPVMGTAAFIIAETLAVSYGEVTKAALIPGILFYLTIWLTINCHSNRLGLIGKNDKIDWLPVLKSGFYYLIPIIFLMVTISGLKWSPIKAGMWSTVLVVIVSQFNKERRMTIPVIVQAMERSAKGAMTVSVACAVAGIIVGVLSVTGLGLKFSTVLLALSGGYKIILLVFTMLAGLILGMGMTTTSVYIVLSVLVAPALVDFGVEPIAAHMFVFYFGILSCITPPVATAVFASASLLNESPLRLGLCTSRIAIPIYMIPFLFVLNPALLMLESSVMEIMIEFILSGLTIIALCSSIEGYFTSELSKKERVLLFVGALCELHTSILVKTCSNLLILVLLLKNMRVKKCAQLLHTKGALSRLRQWKLRGMK